MEVDFALLADAADAVNGKLYLVGGAFDTIWAQQTPLMYPKLSLALRLLFSPAELGRKHKLEIRIMNEDGKNVAPPIAGELEVQKNSNLPKGWRQGFLTVMNFANLNFSNFGDYTFELVMNNTGIKSIPLRIAPPASSQS